MIEKHGTGIEKPPKGGCPFEWWMKPFLENVSTLPDNEVEKDQSSDHNKSQLDP